jgi:hypothetical protein
MLDCSMTHLLREGKMQRACGEQLSCLLCMHWWLTAVRFSISVVTRCVQAGVMPLVFATSNHACTTASSTLLLDTSSQSADAIMLKIPSCQF